MNWKDMGQEKWEEVTDIHFSFYLFLLTLVYITSIYTAFCLDGLFKQVFLFFNFKVLVFQPKHKWQTDYNEMIRVF